MKNTVITRRVDDLGRVVLPKELREQLNINERDPLDISVEDGRFILEKHAPSCIFCGNDDVKELYQFSSQMLCKKCIAKIQNRPLSPIEHS